MEFSVAAQSFVALLRNVDAKDIGDLGKDAINVSVQAGPFS